MKGVRCKQVSRSITSVGLYIPGGTAVLRSTTLMLAVEVLYCAKKAGVTHILKAGVAQAILAMVENFLGPGNLQVTAAKMIFQNSEVMVLVDIPAGPSEVLVIADKNPTRFI
ncbi:hypothetical protein MKX03_010487 [Papaver bracteatum]|nr:hypothetical protein MKX03_010487 [Papaver bracteatum]